MPIEIRMPALSPTMTEGNLARWLKREGDPVSPGDVLAEIETDKATMEIEAVDEGRLGKILIGDGTEGIAVNTPIALLLEEGEDASAAARSPDPAKAAAAPVESAGETGAPVPPAGGQGAQPAPSTTRTEAAAAATPIVGKAGNGADRSQRIFASPLARRMAEQAGIDLGGLKGSGPHGRIIKVDVEQAIQAGAQAPAKAAPPPPAAAPKNPPPPPRPAPAMPAVQPPAAAVTEQPLSNMRRVIARRLTEAKQTIPHFYLSMDCELDALLKLRQELNGRAGADYKLSVNDFVIKAAALALRKVPKANASFGGDKIYLYQDVDIGVAVAIADGLVTPVIRNADRKGLAAISQEMRDFAARARDPGGMKLKPEEYQGGSLSISNLGMYGVRDFQAVINPPQASILAVGAGELRPVIKDGALASATMMTVTLSIDHRVLDGAIGAELLQAFKGYIQDPLAMLL
jgi:pyruvate dehydrogenase E2 component (dihydrolipoamide acetyltransferase)